MERGICSEGRLTIKARGQRNRRKSCNRVRGSCGRAVDDRRNGGVTAGIGNDAEAGEAVCGVDCAVVEPADNSGTRAIEKREAVVQRAVGSEFQLLGKAEE